MVRWLLIALNLGLALFQALVAGPVYNADGLSLAFGIIWPLGLAVAIAGAGPAISRWLVVGYLLMPAGLLTVAYSQDLLVLYVGWEIAGLGLWLALRGAVGAPRLRALALALHAPGWVLLVIALLGLAPALVPPAGGAAQAWPVPLVVAFAGVALARSGCWPFNGWPREAVSASDWHPAALVALYCMAAPFLMAKALVAAGWSPAAMWAVSLLGTLGLLGGAASSISLKGARRIPAIAAAHAGAAIAALGLGPGSPLSAAGAVALLLSGTLWVVALPALAGDRPLGAAGGWSALLGGSLGAWAIAQGALGLGYGVTAVALLPAGALLALSAAGLKRARSEQGPTSPAYAKSALFVVPLLAVAACLFAGIYPQALVEWVVRPAVVAMPGGVGALRELSSDWGLGLAAGSPAETYAALPATGIALAVALALIALYWLRLLLGRFATAYPVSTTPAPDEPELDMDAILPGAETLGTWLDIASLLNRFSPRLRRDSGSPHSPDQC